MKKKKIGRVHGFSGKLEFNQTCSVMRTTAISENSANLIEEGWNDCVIIYDWLIVITTKALDFLKEHKEAKNSLWIKGIERNFISVENMVQEIECH